LLVRAHDGSNVGTDGIGEGPEVELVHGTVIDVAGKRLGNVESPLASLSDLTEELLLVTNVVLGGSDNALYFR
jgi:hypothetical protein